MRPRVAIVGAGPAGAFAAAAVLRQVGDAEIDLFERLPTPWGLLRGGVAPDHQEIKRLQDTFDRQTLKRGCRFLGNVEVGRDVTHEELARHYTAVVYATGAQTDKSLGIPGEDLPGSWAATEFVAWYNGHPDYRDLTFDLSCERAVVIGNGNVAADVTRLLTRSPDELARTDVADHALEALRESKVKEVVVLGRRGPAQAAFTSAELRELGNLEGVDLRVDDVELDPLSSQWLDEEGTFTARKNVAAAARVRRTAASDRRRAPHRAALPRLARRDHAGRGRGAPQRDRPRRPRRPARAGHRRARRDDRVRARPAVGRLPGGAAARRAVRRARLRPAERARPGGSRHLHRRLDQARADRHPRHQQARRRGDDRLPGRGPPRRAARRSRASRSTRCWPSAG